MILRLTDGTTTVNLTGGTVKLKSGYVPTRADITPIEAIASSVRDGGEVINLTSRNVTEKVTVVITDSSWSGVQSSKESIEALLDQAITRQLSKQGDRVYVEYSNDDTTVYRSEILYGKLQQNSKMGKAAWYDEGAMQYTITWRHRFYWEGDEAEMALENGSVASKQTGGVTIQNHDDSDAGDDNWVAIDGDDVEGLLPAAIRLEIENTYATAGGYHYWLGHNVNGNPATLVHVLEGEDADYAAGSASPLASSYYSGGYHQEVSWSGDDATKVMFWDLDDTFLSACAGIWFRVLARFTSLDSDVRVQVKSTYYSGKVIQEAQEVAGREDITDLGALQLPPWLPGETGLQDVTLELWARKSGGGEFRLDYLMLLPADSYRPLTPLGYGLSPNYTLVDDGIEGKVYVTGSSGKAAYYIPRGFPIMLIPGSDQRLYFLCENWSSEAEIDRTHSIRVYYRPRVLTP